MKQIIITTAQEGQRLDRILERVLKNAGKSFLYKMLRKKNITLNGRKASGNEKLLAGDVIRIYFSDETLRRFTGEEKEAHTDIPAEEQYPYIPLDILYEDEQVLFVNKPAGMLSQKAKPSDVSLCEYLIGYLLRSGQISPDTLGTFRPSVCNRLDTCTSGIVSCGKTTAALQDLSTMFRDRTMGKYYETMVLGWTEDDMTLDGYLTKKEETNLVTVLSHDTKGAKPVRTSFHTLSRGILSDGRHTLKVSRLQVHLLTGRSHQIRAHLASVSHPVLGDPKYGDLSANRMVRECYGLRSQLLHCKMITLPHTEGVLAPISGRTITAPLPKPFSLIVNSMTEE